MKFTFLGTGDAGGMPLYGCDCAACQQAQMDEKKCRHPCSALIETGHNRVLLDAGLMDLTTRFPVGALSAIALTHFHPDHVQGLFHLRWGVGASISVFAPPDQEGCADLYKNHGRLNFEFQTAFCSFEIGDLTFTPLPLVHSKITFGYFIEDHQGNSIAYLTDTLGLPTETLSFLQLKSIHQLIIDCSHPPSHQGRNHNNLNDVLHIVDQLDPESTWLTHLSHDMDLWLMDHSLPEGVYVAYDNKVIDCSFEQHEIHNRQLKMSFQKI